MEARLTEDNAVTTSGTLARTLPIVAATAFVSHFAWEVAQCRIFFVHLALPPTWRGMVVATLGDVVMTLLAYLVVAVGTKDRSWYLRTPWQRSAIVMLELFALALAIAVERMGLDMGRWTYLESAPMLSPFGVSLVPVLQLALLFPATFKATTLLMRRNAGAPSQTDDQLRSGL